MSLEIFEEQIKSIEELRHLFLNDLKREYYCSPNTSSIKFTHLHKCVMETSKYPFLNQYIDIYLSFNPQVINEENKKGWTALMLSARNSRRNSSEKTVKLLLEHGVNVNIQNNYGLTALMMAARYSKTDSSEETVKMILEHGANVNIQAEGSWTALMTAARYSKTDSSEETVKLLLEHGANVNIQAEGGWTALMLAVRHSSTYSSEETVKMILKHGANVDIQNENGWTALMMTAIYSRSDSSEETVKLLLEYGADIHITDRDNWNSLYLSLFSESSICTGMIIASYIMKNTVMNISEKERKYIVTVLQSIESDEKNKVIEAFQNHLEIEYAEEEVIRNRYNFIKVKDNVNVSPLNYPRITKSKLYDFKFIRNFQMKTMRDLFLNF